MNSIIVMIGIPLIGLLNIIYRIINLYANKKVVQLYETKLNSLIKLLNENKNISKEYDYLNKKCYEVQNILGIYGIAIDYIDPIRNVKFKNYQILTNCTNEIAAYSRAGINKFAIESGQIINDCIGKYLGYVETETKKLLWSLINPFIWIRDGIRVIVRLPIYLLYWTGIIEYSNYIKMETSIITKIIDVLGFVGTVITIVTGYEPFVNIIIGK